MLGNADLARLRIGIVPYVNVLPLLRGLDEGIPRSRWVSATPRELGGLLASGELDVAILPIFEALRSGSYALLPGCAIGCDGPVRSVQLFSRVPLCEVRRVLLDRSSLTSVSLARVLAADLLRVAPTFETSSEPLTASICAADGRHDAFVVIGDAALAMEGTYPHALDLGEGWRRLTGMPFVFAGWAVAPGVSMGPSLLEHFIASRRRGTAEVDAIVAENPGAGGLAGPSLRHYLAEAIRFELGPPQLAAIEEFRRRLIAHGLIDGATAPIRIATPGNEVLT